MIISDIVKTGEDAAVHFGTTQIRKSIPASTEICSLTEDFFQSAGTQIDIVDMANHLQGSIDTVKLHRIWSLCYNPGSQIILRALDTIEEGIICVDRDGFVFYVNRAYMDILKVKGYKVVGKYIQELEPESLLTACLKDHKAASSANQKIRSLQKYVSVRIVPCFEGSEFRGAFSVFHDVTEVHHLQKDVDKMNGIVDEYSRRLQNISISEDMEIVSRDKKFQTLLREAEIVAETDVPVLICGENGVGKEVVANYIYKCSRRRKHPMITVNCAAIPPDLMESELFGYEEGAFTGALKGGKKGKFELADKGTIFLDEIGDLPFTLQSKLLRVLQQGEIEKIGRQKRIPVDVRVITATNRPLAELMEKGEFRRDLYFRINTIMLTVPPLRERPDDLIMLVHTFLDEYNAKYHRAFDFSTEAYQQIREYHWPGNVRELRNYVERSVILSNAKFLPGGLPFTRENSFTQGLGNSFTERQKTSFSQGPENSFTQGPETKNSESREESSEAFFEKGTFDELVTQYEKSLLEKTIRACGGSRSKAIEQLGMSRRTFFRKCSKYGIH